MASGDKTINIKVDNNFKETKEDLDDLNEGLNEASAASDELNGSTSEMNSHLVGLSPILTSIVAAFEGLRGGLKLVGKGFTTLRGAIIASGIGALVLAITSVTQAFKGSEEGQNKFAKLMYGIGVVMDNILDVLADVGEMLISAFENPIESLKKFGKAIIDNIVNRFTGMLELIPAIGSAISELFSGNFSKAGRIASNAMGKVVFGVDNVIEKVEKAIEVSAEFVKQQEEELKVAGRIADQRASADKLERKLLVSRAKLQTEISKLRLRSREEDTVSAEDRKKALIDAQALEDSLLQKELKVARLRFESIKAENKLARSTKEAKDAEAQAEADLFNIISRRTDQQRATQRELNRVNKEIASQVRARAKLEKQALELGLEFTKETIDEELKSRIASENKRLKAQDELNKKLMERQKVQDALSIEVMDEGIDKEEAKLMAKYDSQILLAEGNAELERQLTEKLEKDITAIKEKEAEKQKAIDDKTTAESIANQQKLNQQKVSLASDGFGALSNLVMSFEAKDKESAKRQFKVNKALQIGQTVASTASGIMNQLAVPQDALTGLNFVKAGIVAATGAASLVKIASSKFDEGSTGGSAPEVSSGGGSQAPSFNVVGNSGINQLAQLQTEPTRAYVVSGEVTSQQSLDRNRQMNATL